MKLHARRVGATRQVKSSRARRYLKQGALSVNLWSTMPAIELGTIADDWKAVGGDMRSAIAGYVGKLG